MNKDFIDFAAEAQADPELERGFRNALTEGHDALRSFFLERGYTLAEEDFRTITESHRILNKDDDDEGWWPWPLPSPRPGPPY